jgi:glyoxylase-like metal-dependent hydrolase (beta-lactamase superfamily II)
VRTLDLGDVRPTYVVDGAMGVWPRVFFPGVPEDHWRAHPEALDDQGRVAMSVGGLLVERGRRALLIDAGFGPFTGDTEMGPVNSGALLDTLKSLGRSPADIESVAFTHLHLDHTGWAFAPGSSGPPSSKVFREAPYFVAADEWGPYGQGQNIPGTSSAGVISNFASVRTLTADGQEIFPGVRTLVTPGHSPGHTSYIITAKTGDRVIAFGDAFHIPAQLAHPEWPSAPDIDGVAVLASRRRLLAELEQPRTTGFAVHFGDQAFGRLGRVPQGLALWEPVPASRIGGPPRSLL